MTVIAIGGAALAACLLILCLPTLAVAAIRGQGRTALRLTVAVVLCTLLTGAIGAYLASAVSAGLSLIV